MRMPAAPPRFAGKSNRLRRANPLFCTGMTHLFDGRNAYRKRKISASAGLLPLRSPGINWDAIME
jgi:hypothetical protein